jgi:hypothetical protein
MPVTCTDLQAQEDGLRIVEVRIVRAEKEPPPEAKAGLDNLLSRWLVRAYLQRHGSKPEVKEKTA